MELEPKANGNPSNGKLERRGALKFLHITRRGEKPSLESVEPVEGDLSAIAPDQDFPPTLAHETRFFNDHGSVLDEAPEHELGG